MCNVMGASSYGVDCVHTKRVFFCLVCMVIFKLVKDILRLYSPNFCLYSQVLSVFIFRLKAPLLSLMMMVKRRMMTVMWTIPTGSSSFV